MQRITSQQNQRVKDAARLTTSRGRQSQGRIAVYGIRESFRALQSEAVPIEALVCTDIISDEQLANLRKVQQQRSFEILDLSRELFKKAK